MYTLNDRKGWEYNIIKRDWFYTAVEVTDIINNKWKDELEVVKEYVDLTENISWIIVMKSWENHDFC